LISAVPVLVTVCRPVKLAWTVRLAALLNVLVAVAVLVTLKLPRVLVIGPVNEPPVTVTTAAALLLMNAPPTLPVPDRLKAALLVVDVDMLKVPPLTLIVPALSVVVPFHT